jgi:hypothetical protein
MAVHGRYSGSQQNCTNYDQENGEGVAEGKRAVRQFAQQEQDAERRDDRGAYQSANGTTTTGTTGLSAHL